MVLALKGLLMLQHHCHNLLTQAQVMMEKIILHHQSLLRELTFFLVPKSSKNSLFHQVYIFMVDQDSHEATSYLVGSKTSTMLRVFQMLREQELVLERMTSSIKVQTLIKSIRGTTMSILLRELRLHRETETSMSNHLTPKLNQQVSQDKTH